MKKTSRPHPKTSDDFVLTDIEEVPDTDGHRWRRILALLIMAGELTKAGEEKDTHEDHVRDVHSR